MRGREGKGGAPPTDLLVCFPSRTHLALMPKPVSSSPARTSTDSTKRHHQNHQIGRFKNKVGHGSPILWAKTKSMESAEMDEPTSPKVTCAGQIKVKSSKSNSCKNWQSVMEEIERLHRNKHKKKKQTWVEALGLKKDVMQVLSCLRGIRVQIPCFSSFHQTVLSSDDEEDEDDQNQNNEQQHNHQLGDASGSSENVLSKWFMVVEENQEQDEDQNKNDSCAPPPNALLLMRCRSAPAKTWLEEQQLQEQEEEEEEEEAKKAKLVLEQNQQKNQENIILKYYAAPDFFKVSSDIAKETWVVGGAKDPLSRSRSWKR
ncbi:nucleolar GTP-binding protein [Thalictrum thalictroides]|uniref:Nucleolar GTP-binding protein n=1 Tax=Thalictrum thalictroides TaxID=46969 RepID=A0A7J6VQE4_THATH|nr:nucleolar GTP-binding protein [Thalictrum thalictroides]